MLETGKTPLSPDGDSAGKRKIERDGPDGGFMANDWGNRGATDDKFWGRNWGEKHRSNNNNDGDID